MKRPLRRKIYRYTAVFEPDPDNGGFTATVPALPGCISEGDTFEQAVENITEAAELHLEVMKGRGEKPKGQEDGVVVAPIHVAVQRWMTRLPALRSREVAAILQRAGFDFIRQRGSRRMYVKGNRGVTIPWRNKDLRKGTLGHIIKQSGLAPNEFLKAPQVTRGPWPRPHYGL